MRIHELAKELGKDSKEIIADYKKIYTKYAYFLTNI